MNCEPGESYERSASPNPVQQVIELAETADLFHTPDRVAYASIEVDGHIETHGIKSRTFKQWLTRRNPLDWKVLVRRHFGRIVQSADIPPIRPYDLRHTCTTLLLAAGENVKAVSERLGHASAALTLDAYSHVLPDMQQQAAERLERILFPAK